MAEIKILLVDDDSVVRLGVSKMLQKKGFYVHVISSAKEIISIHKDVHFDLVLLDINIPGYSGIDALMDIRLEFPKNQLPVIMFSSNDTADDIVNALSLGANDYVSKPVNIDVLVSRIMVQVEIKNMSLELIQKKQLESITAMAITYNHEINNLLTISFGRLERVKKLNLIPEEEYQKIYDTQKRIQDVITKINKITSDSKLSFSDYSDAVKMIDIK